jgi:hypothetical protein
MLFDGGFTFSNFLMDMIAIFAFVVWFWLLVIVFGDLFRRHDISGWGKALWVIALILFSYLSILAYLITQGRGRPSGMPNRPNRRVRICAVWSAIAWQTKSLNSIN